MPKAIRVWVFALFSTAPLRWQCGCKLNWQNRGSRGWRTSDALGEPLGEQAIVGLSDEDLHRLSHQPLRYLDHDHLVPEASHGRDAALLNLLRTKVRETETVAAQVFITRSFEVLRPDILQALNRLSSTVYVMMILSVTKQPLTVKQIQQRLGETQ